MARLQVLRLPATPADPAPFMLVLDEVNELELDFTSSEHADVMRGLKDGVGARFVLATTATVDVA
ncbi:hypothetical protein [Streptomyces sp. NBC_00239]|uniref:hypothetical protein n=1 Tax=Streptomyces sp. NBC_00239 TaxID=2903640 RepID=UPI002E2CEB15|nr:hypothetical protein [Streptomyces sp. NBC_00239]